MNAKRWLNASAILIVLTTSCKSGKPPAVGDAFTPGPDYLAVVARADQYAANDEFKSSSSSFKEIPLQPSNLRKVDEAVLDDTGTMVLLDETTHSVFRYSNDGSYIGRVGRIGRGPGEFILPISIASDSNGYAVVDFSVHRVNLFDRSGAFRSSFIYSGQNFSAAAIVSDNSTGQYRLFGNRWLVRGDPKSIRLLTSYDHDGTFIQSQFPFEEQWERLNLTHSDRALMAADEIGDCFVALPFAAAVWEEKSGTLSKTELHLPDFRPPTIALPEDLHALNNFHTWELTFTPIRGLYAFDGNILIEYETDRRLRYTVAVAKVGSTAPFRTFQTNWLLIGGDHHGTVVLVNNPGKKTGGEVHVALAHLKVD